MKVWHLGAAILVSSSIVIMNLKYGVFGLVLCLVGILGNVYFYNKEK